MIYKNGITLADFEKKKLYESTIKTIKDELNLNSDLYNNSTIKIYNGNLEKLNSTIICQKTDFINLESISNNIVLNKVKQKVSSGTNKIKTVYSNIKNDISKAILAAKLYSSTLIAFSSIIKDIYKQNEKQSTAIFNRYNQSIQREIQKITAETTASITQLTSQTTTPTNANIPTTTLQQSNNTTLIASQLPGIKPENFQTTIENLNKQINVINNSTDNTTS